MGSIFRQITTPKNRAMGVILGLMLLALACIPDPIEVTRITGAPVQIVVSSQLLADRSLVVLVTRSLGALDANEDSDPAAILEEIAINDAVVTLTGDRGTDTLTWLLNGVYRTTNLRFRAGQFYRLDVNSPSFGKVHATAEVKEKVEFEHVEASLYFNEYADTLAQVTYTFVDPEERNWYMINIHEVGDYIGNLLNPRAFTRLLTDDKFNGQSYGERFRVFPGSYQPGDSIAVSIANISEPYYEFMKLRLENRYSFLEFVSEPVNYPSNVVGGRGFFNLYVPEIVFFELK